MKRLKKLSAVLLCLLLWAGCFTGCGEPEVTPSDSVEGLWKLDVTVMELMSEADASFASGFSGYSSEAKLDGITMRFTQDGKIITLVDAAAAAESLQQFGRKYVDYLEDGGMYEMFAAEGTDRETVDQMLVAMNSSMDEIIQQTREAVEDVESFKQMVKSAAEALLAGEYDAETDTYSGARRYRVDGSRLVVGLNPSDLELDTAQTWDYVITDGLHLTLTTNGVTRQLDRVE